MTEVKDIDLKGVVEAYGLNRVAPGRFSKLFVLDMLILDQTRAVNPFQIMDEVRALEDSQHWSRTKPAQPFKHSPLKGLWHKHYFSERFMAKNIREQLRGGKLQRVIEEVFASSSSSTVTEEVVREISHRVTVEPFEARASAGRLTGEWIIFARHQKQNYYLTVTTHNNGDDIIRKSIKNVCEWEFPFLSQILA